MQLGKLFLNNNLILAPMLNVSTSPYRRFFRHFGEIGLVSVPMLYTKRIVSKPKSVEYELLKIEQERPVSVQLIGSDIESIKKSIDFLKSYQFDVLDFNAGCPSRRAINSKEGGFFSQNIKELVTILNALMKYSDKPVSIKIRTGFEKSNAFLEMGKLAERVGLEYITIHGRTVQSRFNDKELDRDSIKKLKAAVSIPVVGNGDISDPVSAKGMLDSTGVDAVMIGRGSIGNPYIFPDIDLYLKSGEIINRKYDKRSLINMIEIYEQYIDDFLSHIEYPHNDFKFIELKRNVIWLSKYMRGSSQFRNEINSTRNLVQLKTKLDNIFNN